MDSVYHVYGDFKGSFFTFQGVSLGNTEAFPEDLKHSIRIYKGELTNASFEEDYKAEKYRKLSSFFLLNVPKIEIKAASNAPYSGSRVYNFSNLLLIDPKIIRTYEINGKTYGEIESKAFGKTEQYPLIEKAKPDQTEQRPVVVDENYTGTSADHYEDDGEKDKGTTPGENLDRLAGGCFNKFWEILGIILFILFMIFLFKKCESDADQCELKRRAIQDLQMEKIILDSIKIEYDKNLEAALLGISKVYFYRNSTDFEVSATGNIPRIVKILKNYRDKQFTIEGYHSGTSIESSMNLDRYRASKMKDTLVSLGINSEQLFIEGKGDKPLLDSTNDMSFSLINGTIKREYNQNMRIEIKWKKKHE